MDSMTSVLSDVLGIIEHSRTSFDLVLILLVLLMLWQQQSIRRKVRRLQNEFHSLQQLMERSLLLSLNAHRSAAQTSKQESGLTTGESADIVPLKTTPTGR
jgi:hypothetical protein